MSYIRIWRAGPDTMGAIYGPNLSDGEAAFSPIASPHGPWQQYVAGLEAAQKLKMRLGNTSHAVIWVTGEDEHLEVQDHSPPPEEDEPDPADWWKK
jgi:hypothetical protein